MRLQTIPAALFVGALVLPLLPAAHREPEKKANRELTMKLKIETDRKRYDLDDTVMIVAKFSCFNDSRLQIQFSEFGCGSAYFYLISEPVGHKANFTCHPIPACQFADAEVLKLMFRDTGWHKWLKQIDTILPHQLAVHLPRKGKGIPEGDYKWRVGYTVGPKADLVALIKKETGETAEIDGGSVPILKGAWEGAVLSEPVTITIGPGKDKK